jgi:hypothetical protein
MRMWMVDPKCLCRKHLCGEHFEIEHKLIPHLRKRRRIDNYIVNNCLELKSIKARHDLLAAEMASRGYNHSGELAEVPDISYLPQEQRDYRVMVMPNLIDLFYRCEDCRFRIKARMAVRIVFTEQITLSTVKEFATVLGGIS